MGKPPSIKENYWDMLLKRKQSWKKLLGAIVLLVLINYLYVAFYNGRSVSSVSDSLSLSNQLFFAQHKTLLKKVANSASNQPIVRIREEEEESSLGRKFEGKPLILAWTKYFSSSPLTVLETFQNTGGPTNCIQSCEYTEDRGRLEDAEAVLFHGGNINAKDMPSTHPSGQVWVYIYQETPKPYSTDIPALRQLDSAFNWTMTYRKDSDVFFPYGFVTKSLPSVPQSLHERYKSILRDWERKKLAVWPVSNCLTLSKREALVDDLKRYIPIDTVGHCGDKRYCKRSDGTWECMKKFEKNFKFYLSFENSLCEDYVTEKFFRPMQTFMVPVVYNAVDFSIVKDLPAKSYIDVRDFNSSKQLADYLLYLDKNPAEYLKYFEWKTEYVLETNGQNGKAWCDLCEKLYENRGSRKVQWYPDLWKWFATKSDGLTPACVDPDKLNFETRPLYEVSKYWFITNFWISS